MPSELIFLATAFLAAFASGLAGFAFALVALSFWLHVVPPTRAVPCVLAASLLSQMIALWRLRGRLRFDLLWPFVIGGLVGVPIGAAAIVGADTWLLRKAVGAFIVLYAGFMLLQPPLPALVHGGRVADGAVGIVAGALGGAAGLSGALMPIWCDLRGWAKDDQRGVYQPFIFVMQAAALGLLGSIGTVDGETVRLMLFAIPPVVLGVFAGLSVYNRVNTVQFRRILMCVLLVSGVLLLV